MNPKSDCIRWGILGLGKIAHAFASDIQHVPNAELYAVASRDGHKAKAFAKQYNVKRSYDSYELLAEDQQIDAVYIASPHAMHKAHSILCMNHKKAVLCEKPLALNTDQLNEMMHSAKANNVLLMEAMWTAFLPHFQSAMKEIRDGKIGRITHIEADFGFQAAFHPESRLMNKRLGGGSLMDIGIYPVFLALSVLGIPKHIEANATYFETGVDASCHIVFTHRNHARAVLDCTFLEHTPTSATITGEKGKIIIHPKFHSPAHTASKQTVKHKKEISKS